MAGKSYYKVRDWDGLSGAQGPYWQRIKKMYVKTGGTTWTQVRKTYVKVKEWDGLGNGPYWRKVFDTASNAVYWNNDRPRIRLNSYRSANYVDAGRVQYMGPDYSGDSSGWSSESIGPYLYGANASDLNNIVSGNGSAISYKYEWLWNTTGNNNDDSLVSQYTSPTSSAGSGGSGVFAGTGDLDRFENSLSYLGADSGNYWDKNFITFKVTATNSTGLQTSNVSDTVYIVKQRPSGGITMVSPSEATPGTTMSASFTYTNSWYNRANLTNSFIEWFAVDNIGDTLISTGTGANRVQVETLSSMTGVSGGSGTSYHVPTLANKYYYVKLTLNNSSTEQAVVPSWFTPLSSFTISDYKSVKTAAANGAFSLSNATKTSRFYDGTEFQRNVSVQIGQSSGATEYEVQIEGQYDGTNGAYNYTNSSWVVLQTLQAAPYVYESDRSNGILTYSRSITNYRNYRFTARSRKDMSLNGAAYSNNGSSLSYVYVYPQDINPATPVLSDLVTATDSLGSYLTFNMSISSSGSNLNSTYEYSLDNGSTWQSSTGFGYINETSGQIYGTGGTSFNLRVRVTNLDQQTSQQSNALSGTFASPPGVPTSVVTKSFVNREGTIFFTTGANTQSVIGYLDYDSFNNFDSISDYINIGSNTAAKINLTGANSSSFSYTTYLKAYSGINKTGNSSALQSYTNKVLAGGDAMTVSAGTPAIGADNRTLTISWTCTGAPTKYIVDLYNYDFPYSLVATKSVSTTSATFTSTDGVAYSTKYYFRITPRYEYTTSVYYDGTTVVSTNITSGSSLTPPSINSVTWDGISTWTIDLNTAGGAGPYYQIWWNSVGTTPPNTQTGYDATSTTSVVTETISATLTAGQTIYFWARSSNENIASSSNSGNATAGTFSTWSSVASYPINNLSAPTISTASSAGSGSTLTVNVTGGGPTYQIYWLSSNSTPGNTVTPDGFSTTTEIIDANGPSGTGTYYVWARSARSASIYGGTYSTAPSIYISPWSTVKSFTVSATRTLSFDANGGTGAPSNQTGTDSGSGATITITSSTPSRSGYTFAGWNTNSSGTGTNYSSNGSITITSDTTLYAKWTINSVTRTLSFDANGGTSAPANQTGTDTGSGATITITSSTPSYTGYTFNGWNTNSAGTGTSYSSGGSITLTSDVTLYAKWTANPTGPTAPTSLSVTAGSVTRSFSTSLVRNTNTNKTQSWSSATSQGVTVSWTKGTGTGTITSDVKWNTTGVAPASGDSGTWNGVSGSSQSDSNGGGTTSYYWVRTSDGNGNKSSWVYAGSYTATSPSMTGLTIRLYRGNGTAFSSPSTPPSSTLASGSYTWSGVTDRGNPATSSTAEGHYAYAAGTLNGSSVSATSSTV